jgi:type I restriction-modification system DNA methylase subunit
LPPASPSFNDRPLRTHLQRCGFEREHLSADFRLGDRTIPLFAFAHRPFDTRTACITATAPSEDRDSFLLTSQQAGAPLAFIGSGQRWSVWQITHTSPLEWWNAERGNLDEFFATYRAQLDPRSIFRAKTSSRESSHQLSFVDAGLLEMVEAESGRQVCGLIERMIQTTRQKLPELKLLEELDAQWLVQANFWLLAARLLQDKQVQGFKTLDLKDLQNVFNRVGKHYGSRMRHDLSPRRRLALTAAASILDSHGSLRLVSTETLGQIYENVLITRETRKALGTHSTPAWLVDYMVRQLVPWIEQLPESRRSVYEPGCGHAPFLVALLRHFSSTEPCLTMSDPDRHAWLQARLAGAETDDFAREVARLSLTLADIPNANGWELDEGNMFTSGKLESRIRNAGIIISNPPFETRPSEGDQLFHVGQAAELLRRINQHAQPGTLLAYIMPQTILDSKKAAALRRDLLNRFVWLEILRLPDKVFDKADVETAVIIGRKLHDGKRASASVRIKHVWEDALPDFQNHQFATVEQALPAEELLREETSSMLVPDLRQVWMHCGATTLNQIATVGHGLLYHSESALDKQENLLFPHGQFQKVPQKAPGYETGFFDLKGAKDIHVLPDMEWMNSNRAAVATERAGYATGLPQIVMNYVRVRRGPWRIKAWIDLEGRRATSNFLIIRPLANAWNLNCLWALLNSPLANAFCYSHSTKKHIYSSRLLKLPVPPIKNETARELSKMVDRYLAGSRKHFPDSDGPPKAPKSKSGAYLAGLEPPDHARHAEELRHQLWRIDTLILGLYGFPPDLEREVLDYFTGYQRPGVPFHQNEYYPTGFQGAQTLAELLSITADWEATNARRLELIDLEYDGKLKKSNAAELDRLQHLAMLRRRLVDPFPFAEQEAEIARLKREGKWSE